jgi:hypothetical protein
VLERPAIGPSPILNRTLVAITSSSSRRFPGFAPVISLTPSEYASKYRKVDAAFDRA